MSLGSRSPAHGLAATGYWLRNASILQVCQPPDFCCDCGVQETAGSGDSGTGQKGLVWDGDWGLTEALFKRGPGILSRSANLCYLWGYWLTLPTATVRPS